jgi:hypothetical protein
VETAADALAVIAALAASACGGRSVDVGTAAQRHRLGDPWVLDLVAEEVEAAVHDRPAARPWAAGLAALDAFQEPALRVAALLLRARVAEGAGCTGQARALVEQCLAVVPGLLPAVRDAAEYELCAGNWARAWELADSIRTAVADPGSGRLPDIPGGTARPLVVPDRRRRDRVRRRGRAGDNLGTVQRGRPGTFTLTANSEARVAALEAHVASMASHAQVTSRSAHTAEQLAGETEEPDSAPDSAAAERRRHGVDFPEPEPVTLILEQYFLPLEGSGASWPGRSAALRPWTGYLPRVMREA